MPRVNEELTLMRIFVGEADRWKHKPLYEVLVEFFRKEGFRGATVLKGAMGFGSHSIMHTDKILRLSHDLPVVIEVADAEEKIEGVLDQLDEMLKGGIVTLEKVRVIHYS